MTATCIRPCGPNRCEFCGGCPDHDCARDDWAILAHIEHFSPFASLDETACGHIGGPAHLVANPYPPDICLLTEGHDGKHRSPKGWTWPAKEATTP